MSCSQRRDQRIRHRAQPWHRSRSAPRRGSIDRVDDRVDDRAVGRGNFWLRTACARCASSPRRPLSICGGIAQLLDVCNDRAGRAPTPRWHRRTSARAVRCAHCSRCCHRIQRRFRVPPEHLQQVHAEAGERVRNAVDRQCVHRVLEFPARRCPGDGPGRRRPALPSSEFSRASCSNRLGTLRIWRLELRSAGVAAAATASLGHAQQDHRGACVCCIGESTRRPAARRA